jgi:hypothetical protein
MYLYTNLKAILFVVHFSSLSSFFFCLLCSFSVGFTSFLINDDLDQLKLMVDIFMHIFNQVCIYFN